jgi:hypothetical protein
MFNFFFPPPENNSIQYSDPTKNNINGSSPGIFFFKLPDPKQSFFSWISNSNIQLFILFFFFVWIFSE